MSNSEAQMEFVGQLGEEFVARFRRGERPAVSEYADRHPQYADEIRELFPALVMMEDVAPTGPGGAAARVAERVATDRAATDQRRVALSRLGDYRIVREVGRGGMGIVYEAEQVSLGRHVALKVLPQQMLLDARNKLRFEREAKAAARLHHTNIVPVFGVGEHEGLSYYVMQFIQGLGLDCVLDELKRLKASDKSATNLATAAEELRVSRRHDVSATDVARSLIEGSLIRRSPPGPAGGATNSAGVQPTGEPTGTSMGSPELHVTIVCQTQPRPQDPDRDPGAAAITEPSPLLPCTRDDTGRSDTATGKLSDTFSLSGPVALSGRLSASAVDAQHHRQTYWQSVAHIGTQVASALQYAHDQGILHRDIKPGNLLLDIRGTVWVTDFGIAKASDQPDITRTGDILGTLRYMPPEAFEGRMDARSDVYSLGLTLYELLALKPAFDDRDRHKLIRLVTTAEPARLEKLNPKIPRDLVTIIHKAIDRDSLRRYQTALELQLDLSRFLADEPVAARPLTLRERGWRWCRRNPAVAVLSSFLFLALTAVTAASTFAYFQESAHRQEIENNRAEISQALERETASKTAEHEAKEEATDRLYQSLVAQARANRLSRRMGQRLGSLEVLAEAARMARQRSLSDDDFLELRNEAIACLILPDVKNGKEWKGWPTGNRGVDFDGSFARYARRNQDGDVSVRRTDDDTELCKLRGLGPGDVMPLLSPDGRFLALWNRSQGCVTAWSLNSPQPILVLNEASSSDPAFSPDGGQLACRSSADSILVVDLDFSRRRHKFQVGNHLGQLAWHPAGRLLASAATQGVQIRDSKTGDLVVDLPHPAATYSVAWHPDGRTLAAVGVDSVIQIWDVASRTPTVQLKGHVNNGINFTFSHDGNLLASTGWDHTLRLWDPRTGELVFQTPMIMERLLFSADDRLLATKVAETAQQFSLVEIVPACGYRKLVRDPVLGRGSYQVASTSPDDRLLAVGMADGVALWDLVNGRSLTFLPCGWNNSVLFEPSGSLLTSGPEGVVRRPIDIDAAPPGTVRLGVPQLLPLTGASNRIAASRDGRVLAKAMLWGGLVWNQDSAKPALQLVPHTDARYITVSPDGSRVATGSHSEAGVRIWNASTGELVRELLPAIGRANVEFSPDGRWLAATGGRLWETDSWTEVRRFDQCSAMAFSPDSRILAMENGKGIVRLVDPESGHEYARLEDPHQDRARDLCFSHDGAQLVATDTDSSTIHVWDLRAIRQELRKLELDWTLPLYASADSQRDAQPLVLIEEQSNDHERAVERDSNLAAGGESAAAAATYRRAFESAPDDVSSGRWWTTLALDSGDAAEYRRACEQLRDRFGKSAEWFHAVHVCWAFMLSDDSVPDKTFLLKLGENLVKWSPELPWTHTSLAGAQLRNGEDAAALRSLDESDRLGRGWHARVTNDFLRAIALARLGRAVEARWAFEKGALYADLHLASTPAAPFGEIPKPYSWDWYTIRLLRREAAALLHAAGTVEKSATDRPAPADTPKLSLSDEQVPDEPKAPPVDAESDGIREK